MKNAEISFPKSRKYGVARRILNYLKAPVLAAFVTSFVDSLVLKSFIGSVAVDTLVLVLFFEGGIGLVAGTLIGLSATPSISTIGHSTIGSAPWSREAEKNAERVAGKWMIASAILVLIGFAVSALS